MNTMSERQKIKAFLNENRDITQEQVAWLAETTPATLSRIINGRRVGRPATVKRVADAFRAIGCEVDAGRILTEAPALEPTG